jgi:hypothetical protein
MFALSYVIAPVFIFPRNITDVGMIRVSSSMFALIFLFPRNIVDVGMIRDFPGPIGVSSYFALRRCLGVASMISFSPDEVSKCVVVGIISHFLLNTLIHSILLFYDDVSCIDDFVQLRIPKFILV